ncbi:MAG: phosphate/phosphite/phosphonate ABC transporter substrate-binding protein [Gammaproteobacteria bacterium]|nr:phosphate/phosphite/phosphonate ABC transporter substrate-binding protein [Gammaproteobacteria bacterium]
MKPSEKPGYSLFVLVLILAVVSQPVVASDETKLQTPGSQHQLVLGIAPFMSPLALIKRMAPLRDYLSQIMGRTVRIETATDAREFTQRTLEGRYHFVLTNPTFALMALETSDFRLVATQKQHISGSLIVKADSEIQSVDQLAGKSIGAPPKVGFLGQLVRPYLKAFDFPENQMPRVFNYNSHNAAISALRLGDSDATLIVSFMEKHLDKQNLPYRVIHRTESFPGMTIVGYQSLSDNEFKQLREILITIDTDAQGRAVLEKINMPGYRVMEESELEKVRPYLPVNNKK